MQVAVVRPAGAYLKAPYNEDGPWIRGAVFDSHDNREKQMHYTKAVLGMQALGLRNYRQRAIEQWIRTKEGRSAEEWCRNNWTRVRSALLPEAKLEGEWWRFSDDPEGGRKYALNEETWLFVDHSDPDIKIHGIIPTLVYARGNSILSDLAHVAEKTYEVNFDFGILNPLPEEILEKSSKLDSDADGVWLWRDLDGEVLLKRVRRKVDDGSGKIGKRFVTLGETADHWEEGKERIAGRTLTNVKMIKKCSPLYGMNHIADFLEKKDKIEGVLIVEGEKACDAAHSMLQQIGSDWIALSPGATAQYDGVDVEILDNLVASGCRVIILPDNDLPGIKAARKLQVRERKVGSFKIWESVNEFWNKKGWDAADLEINRFREAFEALKDGATGRVERLLNQNTLDVPEHGFGILAGTAKFVRLSDGMTFEPRALDMFLREISGKNRPSIRFSEDETTPVVDNLYGYSATEGLLYRDDRGRVCLNRFSKVPFSVTDGISVTDLRESVEWFEDHMEYLVEDDAAREAIVKWLAFNVQWPGTKIHHAVILQGTQGTGKSFLGRMMSEMLGANCRIIAAQDVSRKWNRIYTDASLIVAEELMQGGRDAREFSNQVKHLITGEEMDIEEKYQSVQTGVKNHVNFLFLTNYEDSIDLDGGEDRYLVHFSKAKPLTGAYYRNLFGKLSDPEEMARLYTWFMTYDLREFDHASRAIRTHSLNTLKTEYVPHWRAQLEHMINGAISPFEEGHSIVQIQPLVNYLGSLPGVRTVPSRTVVRNYLLSRGYVQSLGDKFILFTEQAARKAGIFNEDVELDIEELLAKMDGQRWTTLGLNELVEKLFGGTVSKREIRSKIRSHGWNNVVRWDADKGQAVRVWEHVGQG